VRKRERERERKREIFEDNKALLLREQKRKEKVYRER